MSTCRLPGALCSAPWLFVVPIAASKTRGPTDSSIKCLLRATTNLGFDVLEVI